MGIAIAFAMSLLPRLQRTLMHVMTRGETMPILPLADDVPQARPGVPQTGRQHGCHGQMFAVPVATIVTAVIFKTVVSSLAGRLDTYATGRCSRIGHACFRSFCTEIRHAIASDTVLYSPEAVPAPRSGRRNSRRPLGERV